MTETYNLNRMTYFVAVVEEGTITAAAQRLNISKAVVSRQIQLLEQELDTALLIRNTRHLSPTEAGAQFYEQAKAAVDQATNAYRTAREGGATPRGHLRIAAPLDYGIMHITPLVTRFAAAHPDLTVTLHLEDARVDLVENRYDLSFRVGWLRDSANRVQRVGGFEEWVVGPADLKSDRVRHPKDLLSLSHIGNSALTGLSDWSFERGGQTVELTLNTKVTVNATPAMLQAVLTGSCFAIMPDFAAYDSIVQGDLARLLPDWKLREGGIFAVTPPTKYKPAATRQFIDMVAAYHRGGFGQSR